MARTRTFGSLACVFIALVGCGDDTTGSGGSGATGSTSTTTVTTSTSTAASMTTTTGTTTATVGSTVTSSGVGGAACMGLPTAQITPTEVTNVFNGSEDIAMDGQGHIAGKDGNNIILADANGVQSTIGMVTGTAYGLRYNIDGHLIVALPNAGKLVDVAPNGMVTDYVTGVAGPNGVYPDSAGNIWVTEFGGGKVTKVAPDKTKTTIVTGASSPNGIVLDPVRNQLFYTDYSGGRLLRVDPAGGASTEVGTINGAALDGLVMDSCGNVYAMDQGNSRLYRFDLDAGANAIGPAVLLAQFPKNVANAQFGSGPGLNPESLYAGGNPGTIYEVPVGITGAPVVEPP